MSCVDYCTVLPSWEFDKDPACIVTYAFGKDSDEKKDAGDTGEEMFENYRPYNTLVLQCPKCCDEMGEKEPCLISVTCKPQYRVSVTGIHIISESRTVEVYDTSEGYLMTTRGSTLQISDEEGGEQQQRLYKCKISLKETLYGLSVKFLSLQGKDSLTLYNIMFILHPESGDFSPAETLKSGHINMNKVKDYVNEMGDTIPDGAKNLLESMEVYQANQQSAMAGLHGLMAQGKPSSEKFGMMGLMSILSQVSNTNSSQTDANTDASHSLFARGSHMANRESTGNEAQKGTKQNDSDGDMFSMLQDICGRVSNMREIEQKKEEISENATVMHGDSGETEISPRADSLSETDKVKQKPDFVSEKDLKDTEQRLTSYIDQKFANMEQIISEKFDEILKLLLLQTEQNNRKMCEKSSQTISCEDGIDDG